MVMLFFVLVRNICGRNFKVLPGQIKLISEEQLMQFLQLQVNIFLFMMR